jgi:hypothetical protein
MSNWPIFICYRQTDGKIAAARIYELLNKQPVPLPNAPEADEEFPLLDVYFDQAAPGVEDWTAVHEPYLKRARAIIVICTPGSKLDEGEDDWVHREIGWWLENREMAPILVDPLGEDLRYVPNSIATKWPNAQRIRLIESDWDGLSDDERRSLNNRVRIRFLGAIVPSGEAFYRQELEQDRERAAKLRRTRRTVVLSVVGLLVVLGVAVWTFYLKNLADQAASRAQEEQRLALAAQHLAQARVLEGQAARAQIETRLIDILQKFSEYDAYKAVMEQWEEDFRKRTTDLSRRAQAVRPPCEDVAGGGVYEGQMVEVNLPGLPENEALFIYLSVVPGSSPMPGDWAPAVLDVFIADRREVLARRDLKRSDVIEMMTAVAPDNQWGLLMGLGTPHVLTYRGRNYRLRRRSINMNDEGDMVMGIEICQETNTVFQSEAAN